MQQKPKFEINSKKKELLERLLQEEGLQGSSSKIEPRNSDTPAPQLSLAQERLWFLNQLTPESPVYNVPAAVRLQGALDYHALEQAINDIVRRHEALRTTFPEQNDQPVQMVSPNLTIELEVESLDSISEKTRDEEAIRHANQEAWRPFDIMKGPLLRTKLIKIGDLDHLFVVTMHHLVSEVWSVALFFQELQAFYAVRLNGGEASLPELSVQYADYAIWQREYLSDTLLQKQLQYWKEQLGGNLPILQLPTDRPRPATQSMNGSWKSVVLPAQLTEKVKMINRQGTHTLFMNLMAAFAVLLHRYSGQEDILIGSPISGRNRAETERLIGFFINTIVLRVDLSGDPGFLELLQRVRAVVLDAFSHQDVPFAKLIETLHPSRDVSHTPLFQVMFAMQNTPLPDLKLSGLDRSETLTPTEIHNGASKVDLALFIEESDAGMIAGVEYNTDLFEEATIVRILGHYQVLLESITDNPDIAISKLDLLTQAEKQQLLIDWNNTESDYPADICAHKLFETHAEKNPEAVAVISERGRLTYGELNKQAETLARHLRKMGIGPEVVAGICLDHSVETLVAILGILKAGGAYLPIDPAYPKDRIAYMLEDAAAPVLLTRKSFVEQLPEIKTTIIALDEALKEWEELDNTDLMPQPGSDNLAYVIYTSGSTGRPKGVEVTHASLLNLVSWHQRIYEITPTDRSLLMAGPAFDASVWEVWPYLTAGACLYIPDKETQASPQKLIDYLAEKKITVTFLATPLAEKVLDEKFGQEVQLRALLTGGDKLNKPPKQGLSFELVNHYGPTENTVVATAGAVSPKMPDEIAPSIGRPIANTHVYLLDANLNPVPAGVTGELFIAGKSLARGYLKKPLLTAEKFIPDPFSKEAGTRMYKTGDLARFLPDGSLEFRGRIDHQVKVRGYRIELGEIQAVLGQYDGIREVCVSVREDTPGQRRIVAYIVSENKKHIPTRQLRSFCERKLPDYMIPSAFIFIETLPLTQNGKIDRQSLPGLGAARPDSGTEYVAPSTEVQKVIANVWKKSLKVDRVGLYDSFFDLGGHSLLLIEIHSQLKSTLNRDISMLDMFKYPTIASLSEYLNPGQHENTEAEEKQSRGATRREFMQRRKAGRQRDERNLEV